MKAEQIVYALLTGAAPVAAVVADRIYPAVLPEGVTTPAIVYELISSTHEPALDAWAATHRLRARVQVSLLGPDFAVLSTLRDAVVDAMRWQRGSIGGAQVHAILPGSEGPVLYDRELDLFMRPLDFIIHFTA